MPIDPNDFHTGGALQGAVAASLVRERDASAELAPGAQIGIYRVLRELARGGMAIVYLAERADGEYQQQVALKWMLQAQPDAASEALFRRERQALADLRHPHIARLLDGGRTDEGRPWLAMELIQGERLDRHCVQAALPLPQRLALFQQVCAAVAFAHARGVIHRDIKPSNVMVDADGSAKLLDFGIAQLLGQDESLAAGAYTPGFASPEQVRGEPLTVASDVYQLGRLLGSLLSATEHEQDTLTVATSSLPKLGDAWELPVPRRAPSDVVAILHKATAPDPQQRYATADGLAADTQLYLHKRPVAARERSGGYLLARYAQRHPLGLGSGALALVLAIGGTVNFASRLASERDISRAQATRAEAVSQFLVDLFRDSNPTRSLNVKLSANELVDRGVRRLMADDSLPPETAGQLRATLADIQLSLGENNQAADLLIDSMPGQIGVARHEELLGRLAQNRGDPRSAAAHFTRAAAIEPTPRLELYLAGAQLAGGETESARASLDRLIERGSAIDVTVEFGALTAAGALRLGTGETNEALELWQRALLVQQRAPARISEVPIRINTAVALIKLARFDEALRSLDDAKRALVTAPNAYYALLVLQTRGNVHFRRGEYDKARDAWTEVLELTADGVNPGQHASMLNSLGTTHEADGDALSALDYFLRGAAAKTALGEHPAALGARVNAAFKLSELGLIDESLELSAANEQEAIALGRPDLQLRAIQARAKAQRVSHSPAVFRTLDAALDLVATQQDPLKQLELHEARAEAAVMQGNEAQMQEAAQRFAEVLGSRDDASLLQRAALMRALLASEPQRELETLARTDQAQARALLLEMSLAKGDSAASAANLKKMSVQPNATYWSWAERVARGNGDLARLDEAQRELQRLREGGLKRLQAYRLQSLPHLEPQVGQPGESGR